MGIFPHLFLRYKELMSLNCGDGEDSGESLGQQGRSNQLILKEMNPQYSSKGLMLKLKLQYFGHLMQRADSLEKTLMVGKTEGKGEHSSRGYFGDLMRRADSLEKTLLGKIESRRMEQQRLR